MEFKLYADFYTRYIRGVFCIALADDPPNGCARTSRPRRIVTWEGFLRHGSPQSHREAVHDLAERGRLCTIWPRGGGCARFGREGEAVHDLAEKIEAGDDLTPFLSDDVRRFGYVQSFPMAKLFF